MRKFLKMTVITFLSMCLMACGEVKETETLAVSIVSGYHDNASVPNFYSETVQNALTSACKTYGRVTLIVNDGSPYVALDAAINPPAKEGLSENKKATIAAAQVQEINGIIAQAKAKTEEVDTMAAIHLSARGLRTADAQRKVLILLDNGLSTTGVMNFVTGNLLQQDSEKCAEEVVSQLLNGNEINASELEGVDVIWVGLGDVAGMQEQLSHGELETLKAVWQSVLEHMGAETVTLSEELPSGVYEEGLPEVSTVETKELQNVSLEQDLFMNGESELIFNEQTLPFEPDSAKLQNPEEARSLLEPVAELLTSHPEVKVLLAGTTATVGSQQSCEEFSQKRAYTLAELLVSMGVSEEQLMLTGLGYEHDYHEEDIDENGSLIDTQAQKNRSVIILNASSGKSEKIMQHFEIIRMEQAKGEGDYER